jgi:ubiquinone/menaquinone biosynthesis C-methylase UbiE
VYLTLIFLFVCACGSVPYSVSAIDSFECIGSCLGTDFSIAMISSRMKKFCEDMTQRVACPFLP